MSNPVSLQRVYDKVIFDMDGTLVDSRAVVHRVWRNWASRHGLSVAEILTASHGRRTLETMQEFAPAGTDYQREAEKLEAEETADVKDIRAVGGALELLRWLPKTDWAVVTSASRELASRRLSAAGLPLPKVLIAAEDVTVGKPHPKCYLLAIEAMQARPDECLVFEDAPAGIMAGKAAGCDVVAITSARPHDFDADCPKVFDYNSISFSLQSTPEPRRWSGRRN